MPRPNILWLETSGVGEWLNAEAPTVNAADRGLAYGDGVFETVKVHEGVPLFLDRHLQRLGASLEQLRFPALAHGAIELQTRCEQVVAKNAIAEGVLKIVVTRGVGARGFAPPTQAHPVLIVQATPRPTPASSETSGLSAVLAPWKVDPASPLCGVKSLSALDKVWARQWAQAQGVEEALFENMHGHLTEATGWNLFVVKHGQVLTPAQHCGLLPGVTRALLLETSAVAEAELPVEALSQAEEAFLTNAVSGIRPLINFRTRPIGAGQPGLVTQALAVHLEQLQIDYVRRAKASRKATVL